MKLGLEEKLLEQKIRFYLMLNGIIAIGFFATCAIVLYKVMKVLFA